MKNKIYLNDLNAIEVMTEGFNEWLLSKTCILPVTTAEFLLHCKNSRAFKARWAPDLEFEDAPTMESIIGQAVKNGTDVDKELLQHVIQEHVKRMGYTNMIITVS
jgi:hypothetical protein